MKIIVKLLPLLVLLMLCSNSQAQVKQEKFVIDARERIDSLTVAGDLSAAVECGVRTATTASGRGMYNTAAALLDAAERTAANNNLDALLATVYKTQAANSEHRGNYKTANEYLQKYYRLRDRLAAEEAERVAKQAEDERLAAAEAAARAEATAPNPLMPYYIIIGALALLYLVAAVIWSSKRRRLRRQIAELEKGHEVKAVEPMAIAIKAEEIRSTAEAMLHDCRKEGFDFRTEVMPLLSLSRGQSLTAANIVAFYETDYKPEITSVDLDKILKRAAREFEPAAHLKNIRLDYKSTGKNPIETDEHLIELAVDNLVDNAIKYSPSGKTVSLWIETVDNKTIIGIDDHGEGIDSAKLKALLAGEIYETADSSLGSDRLGLGIAVCRKAAEITLSTLSIESTKEGTTATITFR